MQGEPRARSPRMLSIDLNKHLQLLD